MAMLINYSFEGLGKLAEDAQRAGANVSPLIRAALVNSTTEIQSQARSRAPHRTGTLQRSILVDVKDLVGTVSVNEKYGIYLEQGTGIYGPMGRPITPKRASVLAWKGAGGTVFARSVKGMKARPFFAPGYEASLSYINEQFAKVAQRLIDILAGRQ